MTYWRWLNRSHRPEWSKCTPATALRPLMPLLNACIFRNSYCNVHQRAYHGRTVCYVPCVVRIGDPLSRKVVWTVPVSSSLSRDSPHKPEMVDSLWPREPTGHFRPTCVGSIRIVFFAWLERQVFHPIRLSRSRPFVGCALVWHSH